MRSPFLALLSFSSCAALASTVHAAPYAVPDPTFRVSTPSMVAAMVMAADSFSRVAGVGRTAWAPPADWSTRFLTQCTAKSQALRTQPTPYTGLQWFVGLPAFKECNPLGIAQVFTDPANGTHQNWANIIIAGADGMKTDTTILDAFVRWKSPVVLVLYGTWDHWAVVTSIDATNARGYWELNSLTLFDALDGKDLLSDDPVRDPVTMSVKADIDASVWRRTYYYVTLAPYAPCQPTLRRAGDCHKPPYSDPWYLNYPMLIEPPPGSTLLGARDISTDTTPIVLRKAASLVPTGQMSESLAAARVFDALRLAGAEQRPGVRSTLAEAQPDSAVLVHGVWPSGEPWDYYLVPLRNREGKVSSFVQLAAEDGAYQMMSTPANPIDYQPVDADQARAVASSKLLPGQRLGDISLRWDARTYHPAVRSPYLPYYELQVLDSEGNEQGTLRVARHNGKALTP